MLRSAVRPSLRSFARSLCCGGHHSAVGEPTRVRAAVATAPQKPLELRDLLLEPPREDELLVRVVASGICHTDMAVRDGHIPSSLPLVLGHEGVGVVEQIGRDVTNVSVGDHVLMTYSYCGTCYNCKEGKPSYCVEHRPSNFSGMRLDGSTTHTTLDGDTVYGSYFRQSSFATHALATSGNVVKVEKDLPLEAMAPFGCGVQTGAGAVLNTLKAGVGSRLAVFGCGSVGLSSIMAARVVGATHIIAVDTNPARLELAREVGATHTFAGTEEDIVQQLHALSREGTGLDYTIDTTGVPDVLSNAFLSLRPLGTAALVGGSAPGSKVPLDMLNLLLGRSVRGVIQGDSVSAVFLPQLMELFRQGRFPVDKLITYYDSLEDINSAIDDSLSGTVVKPVLRIG